LEKLLKENQSLRGAMEAAKKVENGLRTELTAAKESAAKVDAIKADFEKQKKDFESLIKKQQSQAEIAELEHKTIISQLQTQIKSKQKSIDEL
jgi:hypothetical protein